MTDEQYEEMTGLERKWFEQGQQDSARHCLASVERPDHLDDEDHINAWIAGFESNLAYYPQDLEDYELIASCLTDDQLDAEIKTMTHACSYLGKYALDRSNILQSELHRRIRIQQGREKQNTNDK